MIDRREFLLNCAVVTGGAAAGMDVMASEGKTSDAATMIKGLVKDGMPIEHIGYVSHSKAAIARTAKEVFGEETPNHPYFRTLYSIICREFRTVHPDLKLDFRLIWASDKDFKKENGLVDFNDLLEFGASDMMPQADIKIMVFEGPLPSLPYAAALKNIFSKSMVVFLRAQPIA
jgi:hypothetical protein